MLKWQEGPNDLECAVATTQSLLHISCNSFSHRMIYKWVWDIAITTDHYVMQVDDFHIHTHTHTHTAAHFSQQLYQVDHNSCII